MDQRAVGPFFLLQSINWCGFSSDRYSRFCPASNYTSAGHVPANPLLNKAQQKQHNQDSFLSRLHFFRSFVSLGTDLFLRITQKPCLWHSPVQQKKLPEELFCLRI